MIVEMHTSKIKSIEMEKAINKIVNMKLVWYKARIFLRIIFAFVLFSFDRLAI